MWRCPAIGIRNLLAVLHWHLHTLLPRYLLALLGGSAKLHRNIAAESLMLHLVMYSLPSLMGLGGSSLFLLQRNFLGSKTNGKTNTKTKFLANVPTHYCTKA